jgi:hypothetical protein
MPKENQTDKTNRREFLSKSFKAVVSASMAIVATKVTAYDVELGQDSTDVTLLKGGGTNVPHSSHSSHSSRSWR